MHEGKTFENLFGEINHLLDDIKSGVVGQP